MAAGDRLPRMALRRDLGNLDVGMAQKQPQQFAAGIAGASDNGDPQILLTGSPPAAAQHVVDDLSAGYSRRSEQCCF